MSRACVGLGQRLAVHPSRLQWSSIWSIDQTQRGSVKTGLISASATHQWRHPIRSLTTTRSYQGSSVSASEVEHFTSLASSWWDPHGPSKLLHLMNPLRHTFIRSCLRTNENLSAERATKYAYLDIGCGGGIFASSAARLPHTESVTAIDPTPEVIKVAKAHQRSDPALAHPGRLSYVNCAIEDLDARSESKCGFDIVTMFEVIEHVDKPAAFLREAMSHLESGGWLTGSTIARHPLSYLTTKVIAEAPWPVGIVPPGTHDWDKYINPTELQQWVAKENRDERARQSHEASDTQEDLSDKYGKVQIAGCVYLPLVGWRWVDGSEHFGNYFFGIQKLR